MPTFAYYLLKIIICSGILYGYYLIALRDKIFHKWNRFYLLAAVVLSLAAPLIKINIWQKSDEPKTQVIHFLQVVNSNDEIVYEYTKNNSYFKMNASDLAAFIYVIISGFLLAFLIQTLYKINRLKNKYQQTVLAGINFINTDANGTPFSFFNNIFWNDKIDINTATGKHIFHHEVAHVQEKHSYDKVFINIILIFFWINPFFWLIRKELNIIHEFIADKKALEDSDTAAFAAMILQATYPQQQFTITNNFFYSPLKRRLLMLTKNKNPKISYASRLLVLPLAALVFFAFTFKIKTITNHFNSKDTIHSTNNQYHDALLTNARIIDTKNHIQLIADIIKFAMDSNKTPDINSAVLVVNGKVEPNDILKTKTITSKKLTIYSVDEEKMIRIYGAKAKNGVFVFEDAVITDTPPYYPKELTSKDIADKRKYRVLEIINGNNLSVNDSIPKFYNGKKLKEANGSEGINKTLILY